ncbi:MAG: hypothetical protein BECKG1743F_GA0114225_110521 [Candidatus Kentron sp. G]|nr:MAG: hypothetical protein BECKG1743F_GA0114225_110521 [Candidatus Kentron sp. G]
MTRAMYFWQMFTKINGYTWRTRNPWYRNANRIVARHQRAYKHKAYPYESMNWQRISPNMLGNESSCEIAPKEY